MRNLTIGEISKAINGEVIVGSGDMVIHDVIQLQDRLERSHTLLFERRHIPLDWEKIKQHTPCAVVLPRSKQTEIPVSDCTVIVVDDVKTAFYQFVDYYRNLFTLPVVAVTGTCGKSTTKEMIMHIFADGYKVQGTIRSNNSVYQNLPYLLGIEDDTDVAVFETAVGSPGHLLGHCRYFKPTIGVITNIGVDHLNGCKTLEGYIQAKAEMLKGLNNQGIFIINADCANTATIDLSDYRGRVVTVGVQNPADFRASNITFGQGGMDFTLHLQQMSYPVFIPGYGDHQVYNALVTIAVAHQLGRGVREVTERLCSFENMSLHMEVTTGLNGCTIIDDTWKFNPDSIEAGLQVLAGIKQTQKSVLLIDEMSLYKKFEQDIYTEVGEMVKRYRVDILVTIGDLAKNIAQAAINGSTHSDVYICDDHDQAFDVLTRLLNDQTILLLKVYRRRPQSAQLARKLRKPLAR